LPVYSNSILPFDRFTVGVVSVTAIYLRVANEIGCLGDKVKEMWNFLGKKNFQTQKLN
jgi:hypothetical protein